MMKSALSWWGSAVWDCIIESWIEVQNATSWWGRRLPWEDLQLGLKVRLLYQLDQMCPFFIIRFGIVEKWPKYHPSVSRSALRSNFWPNAIAGHRCPLPSLLTNHMLRAHCGDTLQLFLQLLWRLHSSSAWALSWEKVAPWAATIPRSSCQTILPWLYG